MNVSWIESYKNAAPLEHKFLIIGSAQTEKGVAISESS